MWVDALTVEAAAATGGADADAAGGSSGAMPLPSFVSGSYFVDRMSLIPRDQPLAPFAVRRLRLRPDDPPPPANSGAAAA